MKRSLVLAMLLILAAVFSSTVSATVTPPAPTPTATPSALPRPVVMLREYGEALLVRGSITRFVLYDTGQVIFMRRNVDSEYELASVMLDAGEVDELMTTLAIDASFYALEDYYEATERTDDPTNVICAWSEELGDKCASVYGDMSLVREGARMVDSPIRLNTSPVFLNVYDNLLAFDHPDAETWLPNVFEITLWQTESDHTVELAGDFPQIEEVVTGASEEGYTVYVDSAEYERFLEFVTGATALRIDGLDWSFSIYLPYPHEEIADA